jgi:hypothetical protein
MRSYFNSRFLPSRYITGDGTVYTVQYSIHYLVFTNTTLKVFMMHEQFHAIAWTWSRCYTVQYPHQLYISMIFPNTFFSSTILETCTGTAAEWVRTAQHCSDIIEKLDILIIHQSLHFLCHLWGIRLCRSRSKTAKF